MEYKCDYTGFIDIKAIQLFSIIMVIIASSLHTHTELMNMLVILNRVIHASYVILFQDEYKNNDKAIISKNSCLKSIDKR